MIRNIKPIITSLNSIQVNKLNELGFRHNTLFERGAEIDMCDIHLDINRHGIIHIWTNSDKWLKCWGTNLSSCSFEILDKENK